MRIINRLFLSSGINHSLNIATIIQQVSQQNHHIIYHDYLVLLIIAQSVEDNLKLLQQLGLKFKKIVYSFKFLQGETAKEIAPELQNIAFDEVYSYLACTSAYILAKTKRFLIDEGLTSYIDIVENHGYQAHFLHLPQLSNNNYENLLQIDRKIYLANIKKIALDYALKEDSILYIASREVLTLVEVNKLVKIIENFLQAGHRVYFKLHPRGSKDSFAIIKKEISQANKLILINPKYFLLEQFILNVKPQKVFGFMSTALINCLYIYNIPSYLIPYTLKRKTYYFEKVLAYDKYLKLLKLK